MSHNAYFHSLNFRDYIAQSIFHHHHNKNFTPICINTKNISSNKSFIFIYYSCLLLYLNLFFSFIVWSFIGFNILFMFAFCLISFFAYLFLFIFSLAYFRLLVDLTLVSSLIYLPLFHCHSHSFLYHSLIKSRLQTKQCPAITTA